jgi:hypothetical protein
MADTTNTEEDTPGILQTPTNNVESSPANETSVTDNDTPSVDNDTSNVALDTIPSTTLENSPAVLTIEEIAIAPDPTPDPTPDPIPDPTSDPTPDPDTEGVIDPKTDWFNQMQYVIFNSELTNLKKGNMNILKECADSKRLLDLKFLDLTNQINRVQTSVIFLSTISGFLNATKDQFSISESVISVISISISTYVTLVLSISKYYKFDEMREGIQALREKYAVLHNKIEHRSDVLGPWYDKNLWLFANPNKRLHEWAQIKSNMDDEYQLLIETKKALTTEFEIIMDTRSRNVYNIVNKRLTYNNRKELADWAIHELELEASIEDKFAKHDAKRKESNTVSMSAKRRQSIQSGHEAIGDNWDEDDIDF